MTEKRQAWPQAIVGPLGVDNQVARAYGVGGESIFAPGRMPATFLIGPDGTVVAKGLRDRGIGDAVGKALGQEGE